MKIINLKYIFARYASDLQISVNIKYFSSFRNTFRPPQRRLALFFFFFFLFSSIFQLFNLEQIYVQNSSSYERVLQRYHSHIHTRGFITWIKGTWIFSRRVWSPAIRTNGRCYWRINSEIYAKVSACRFLLSQGRVDNADIICIYEPP